MANVECAGVAPRIPLAHNDAQKLVPAVMATPACLPSETARSFASDVIDADGSHVGTPDGEKQHSN